MRLTEFVARPDVGDAFVQIPMLKPGSLADVEMIDRMQVVIEARQRHFARAQATAISKPPFYQQNVEASAGEICAEDQPVVPGADDDPVIASFEWFRQRSKVPSVGPLSGPAPLDCRGLRAPVNGCSRMAGEAEIRSISNLLC